MRIPGLIPDYVMRRAYNPEFTADGTNYDFSIGAFPFVSAADHSNPFVIKSVPLQSNAYVTANGPLERSLSQWWLQGMASWHAGAGQPYRDSPDANTNPGAPEGSRYANSFGVDPWTRGQLTLLPRTTQRITDASTVGRRLTPAGTAAAPVLISNSDTTLSKSTINTTTDVWTTTNLTISGIGAIRNTVVNGDTLWICAADGIYRSTVSGFASATKIYSFTSPANPFRLYYFKERLICLAYDANAHCQFFELDQSATASTALPTADYTFPTDGLTWVGCTDGPVGIYTATATATRSWVHLWTIDTSTGTPKITAPVSVAELPGRELITSIYVYAGSMLGLTTTRGIRVAALASDGSITMGPQLVTPEGTYGAVTGGLSGWDRFLYAGFKHQDGTAGLMRVDLSYPLIDQRYPYQVQQRYAWAPDLAAFDASEVPIPGATDQVTTLFDKPIFSVPGVGVFSPTAGVLVPRGWVQSSTERFGTLEPKWMRFTRLMCQGSFGSVEMWLSSTSAPPGQRIISLTLSQSDDSGDVPYDGQQEVAWTTTLYLNRDPVDLADSPVVVGWQLKAFPAQPRQTYFIVPLLCFDRETDNGGQELGNNGSALSKLMGLRAYNQSGEAVRFKVLHPYADQQYNVMVTVEDLQYVQEDSPRVDRAWGGKIQVTLRSVDA